MARYDSSWLVSKLSMPINTSLGPILVDEELTTKELEIDVKNFGLIKISPTPPPKSFFFLGGGLKRF